jgi:hypothetical protein
VQRDFLHMSRTWRVASVAGAVLVAGLVVAVIVVARLGSGHGAAVAPIRVKPSLTRKGGAPPPPPPGALVLAREAGSRAVALAVARGRRPRLIATVLASSGDGDSGLPLSFRLGPEAGRLLEARPCGHGCYTARAPVGTSLRQVDVLLPGGRVAFRLPPAPRPAGAIVSRAARVFRRLRSLVYVESLRSGPTGGIVTTWRLQAPDQMTYHIRGGASAVVIGRRRWDRAAPGAAWTRSSQLPPLEVPQPTWGEVVVDPHLLAPGRVDGRSVWVVSFANPTIPAWFTAWIDRRDYRTLRLRMTAAGHFMFHRYVEFDRPLRIRPPR